MSASCKTHFRDTKTLVVCGIIRAYNHISTNYTPATNFKPGPNRQEQVLIATQHIVTSISLLSCREDFYCSVTITFYKSFSGYTWPKNEAIRYSSSRYNSAKNGVTTYEVTNCLLYATLVAAFIGELINVIFNGTLLNMTE